MTIVINALGMCESKENLHKENVRKLNLADEIIEESYEGQKIDDIKYKSRRFNARYYF